MQTVKEAIDLAGGVSVVAQKIKISERAIYKWIKNDSLPRSEYTDETSYAEDIAALNKEHLTKKKILEVGRPKKRIATNQPTHHVQKATP